MKDKKIILNNSYFCKLSQIKKRNNQIKFDYYYLFEQNKHKKKAMFTFTYPDDDRFFKMQTIVQIRNYFNQLIRNTKNEEIKFFSNIELGKDHNNPHLHVQVFYTDEVQMLKIYYKVIDKFGLIDRFCPISEPETSCPMFHYLIKDYSSNLTDSELLFLDEAKREYRAALEENLRFVSSSKGENTKAVYRKLYAKGLKRETVDFLLDRCVIDTDGNIINTKTIKFAILRLLIQILNKSVSRIQIVENWPVFDRFCMFFFEYWVYGFL